MKTNYKWMENYAPPGIFLKQEITYYIVTMVVSTLWSMVFLLRYFDERGLLFEKRLGKLYLRKGVMMPSFEVLTENVFDGFLLAIIFTLIIAVYHYFYHYQGSKMMYLMKRLPNKWELHIRCLALPIIACIIAVIYMNIVKLLYYAIYILATPSQCLPM